MSDFKRLLRGLAGEAHRIRRIPRAIQDLERRTDALQRAMGRVESRQTASLAPSAMRDSEFQVYSQWGEDGLVQHLVRHVPIDRSIFVECGVESYVEANTRFLLQNDAWSGLLIEGSADHVRRIRRDPVYWHYNLKVAHAFVTRDNINTVLAEHGLAGDIGLLSIDIDGNDYWIWEALEQISPRIVISEYNSLFGYRYPLTVPYQPDFDRRQAHPSWLYWGASLPALQRLASARGYILVACGSAGINAFFVRRDVASGLPDLLPEDAYVASHVRIAGGSAGPEIMDLEDQRAAIATMPLVDLDAGETTSLAALGEL